MVSNLDTLSLLPYRLLVELHADQVRPGYIVLVVEHGVADVAGVGHALKQE